MSINSKREKRDWEIVIYRNSAQLVDEVDDGFKSRSVDVVVVLVVEGVVGVGGGELEAALRWTADLGTRSQTCDVQAARRTRSRTRDGRQLGVRESNLQRYGSSYARPLGGSIVCDEP